MKFKKIVPYVLGAMLALPLGAITSHNKDKENTETNKFETKYKISAIKESLYNLEQKVIEEKVELLISNYIDNAVGGAKRIIANQKKNGYRSAVRRELPGAPVSQHCLYGQYTQLNRAIEQVGDTIQIIPKIGNSHMATNSFKRCMTKMYDNPNYPNSIYKGRLYTTQEEYTKARNRYIYSRMHSKKDTMGLHDKYTKDFAKNNYCVTDLNPGTIIIVSSGHAVMYLGIGKIKNDEFVPDENGRAVCCAYNGEHTAIYLSYWDTNNAFSADIQNIATQKYITMLEKQY